MLMVMVILGMLFVSGMQPVFMISSLILIVMFYSYLIYVSMSGYWFGYMLLMVMLSGVLVVFTYMVSLIPNESFENYNMMYMIVGLLLFMGVYFIEKYDYKFSVYSLELWESYFSFFNLFMVSFLLGMMLIVVWLSYIGYGAIRV